MGYMRRHAIVITTWRPDLATELHRFASGLFPDSMLTPLLRGPVNGDYSFAVLPDGSKEGWDESDKHDKARDLLKGELRRAYYGDGSSPVKWVEVQFGDDEHVTTALNSSDQDYQTGKWNLDKHEG